MEHINIFELLEQNKDYESCNIEFEPYGSGHSFIDFHSVLEMREQFKALVDFVKGEWVDTDIICKALNIDFITGIKMFDFSRTAEWNPPPLNGQTITTKFRIKREVVE